MIKTSLFAFRRFLRLPGIASLLFGGATAPLVMGSLSAASAHTGPFPMLSILMTLGSSASGITAIVLGIVTMIRRATIWLPVTGMALAAVSGLWLLQGGSEPLLQPWW